MKHVTKHECRLDANSGKPRLLYTAPRCILNAHPPEALTKQGQAGAHMTQNPGKPVSPADPRALDIYDFAKSGRQAAGALRVSQMPRMLAEVPADAPDGDVAFTWQ